MIRRWLLILALLGAPVIASSCAPVSVQTPAGKAAFTAGQIMLRLNELQNAAIQANAAQGLPEATTRLIVQFVVTANTTLKAAPQGWQTTVQTGWRAVKAQLPPTLPPSLATSVAVVDALLSALEGA